MAAAAVAAAAAGDIGEKVGITDGARSIGDLVSIGGGLGVWPRSGISASGVPGADEVGVTPVDVDGIELPSDDALALPAPTPACCGLPGTGVPASTLTVTSDPCDVDVIGPSSTDAIELFFRPRLALALALALAAVVRRRCATAAREDAAEAAAVAADVTAKLAPF